MRGVDERNRRLEEFDRSHGLVNGRKPRTTGAMDIAAGILLAVFVLAVIAVVVVLIAAR